MYIYWNLFIHYGHVSTSVLLMVIHTCVIFFLTQAPLGVGPGCHVVISLEAEKTCVAQTWRQVLYKTTVSFGWFESNMSNPMASSTVAIMIHVRKKSHKWKMRKHSGQRCDNSQSSNSDWKPWHDNSWRCSTPATATCCCQWIFTNRYNEIISMYAISFLNPPNRMSNKYWHVIKIKYIVNQYQRYVHRIHIAAVWNSWHASCL